MARRKTGSRVAARADGFASSLEATVAAQLDDAGIPYEYEVLKVPYVQKLGIYTPDKLLPNGIIIEEKGYFDSADRAKHKRIREQCPDLDIRFVFGDAETHVVGQKVREFRKWMKQKYDVTLPKKIPNEVRAKHDADFYAETGLRRPSSTTYADWCRSNGFQFSTVTIPQEWLEEPLCATRMEAANSFRRDQSKRKVNQK